ncbi:hypothetical protein T492DRAFT_1021313 [Pavlovales sp. CCMP2436]|nr:hypothetical protein T492DRAFT_1021313 [Pavlovales sp. CCMP2436]
MSQPFFTLRLLMTTSGCFAVGAGMELFMIKTGFYKIVTEKEAERYIERVDEHRELLRRTQEQRAKSNST